MCTFSLSLQPLIRLVTLVCLVSTVGRFDPESINREADANSLLGEKSRNILMRSVFCKKKKNYYMHAV